MNELAEMLAAITELYEAQEGEAISVSDAALILARTLELAEEQNATHGKGGNGHAQ
jgi:hypothetical protein